MKKPNEVLNSLTCGLFVYVQATPARCDICKQEGVALVQFLPDQHAEAILSHFFCKEHFDGFREELMATILIPGA